MNVTFNYHILAWKEREIIVSSLWEKLEELDTLRTKMNELEEKNTSYKLRACKGTYFKLRKF